MKRGALAVAAPLEPRRRLTRSRASPRRRERPIPFSCLQLGEHVAIAHLPGETFIEYQLHAQAARPDAFVAVAGYGDLGTGYITLASSFAEGGYEPQDAFVSGASEALMRTAIDEILKK